MASDKIPPVYNFKIQTHLLLVDFLFDAEMILQEMMFVSFYFSKMSKVVNWCEIL